jgi:Ca-activated chloride channel family protein
MSGFDFRDPALAALILAVPLLYLWSAWRRKRGSRDAAIRFSNLRPFRGLPATPRLKLRFLVPFLRGTALVLLALALMRPQKGSELAPERAEGISILMAVDASYSMNTDDFTIDGKKVSRLEAVKKVFHDFVKGTGGQRGRPNDEIGIVSFTGYPVPLAPLTLDHGAVLDILSRIKVYDLQLDRLGQPIGDRQTIQEETSTAIGDGLALAVDRLKDLKSKSKVIILMSDGAQTAGQLSPQEGADLARAYGIKIYSIGIGQAGVVLREVQDPFFGTRKVPMKSDLDEDTLREVAEKTGGRYWNAASTDALSGVYQEIDGLERSTIESSRFYRFDEKFQWLALPALGVLVLEVLLGQTVFRRIP